MQKALKIADLELNAEQLNNPSIQSSDKDNILDADEIRVKIKAARLEKLMARQLENELSFELDSELKLNLSENEQNTLEEAPEAKPKISTELNEDISKDKTSELARPASKMRGYSAGTSKRMRYMQKTKHSCDEIVSRIRTGSELISALDEQTSNLVKQVQFMEQEFANFEDAEAKAAKLAIEHRRVTNEYEEALNLIEKQNRQLDVLENQRSNSNANYETTKLELEKLQRQYQKEVDLFTESQMLNTELEQDNKSLKSKLEASEAIIQDLNESFDSTSSALKQKDMEAARALAELLSTKERLTNSELSLNTTNEELEILSRKLTDKEIELQSSQSKLTSTNEKLQTAEVALERTTGELEIITHEAHEKDMLFAKLTSDYSSLIKSNSKISTDLDNLQNKHDELNKSALEQQSQQYARIHELESVLRDTKRRLEVQSKENAETKVELEATNNLLVLHEEMVTALSPKDK